MNTNGHSKLAWCATFARLLAFETNADIKTAMRIAMPAYERDGRLPPGRAVQNWLHSALTWPGTDLFMTASDGSGDSSSSDSTLRR